MFCRRTYLFEIVAHFRADVFFVECETVKADDGVHRGADFVAHVREEYGLCLVCFFGDFERVNERLVSGEGFVHFFVYV